MTIDSIKTKEKKEALAFLEKHLDTPELVYAAIERPKDEFSIDIKRPMKGFTLMAPLANSST